MGTVINTIPTPISEAATAPMAEDIEQQLAYTRQQQLDAYSHILEHAEEQEAVFNARTEKSRTKTLVEFCINELVQVYCSNLDYTFKMERKLLPKWGPVRRIVARDRNAYKLSTIEGLVLKG